MSSAATRCCTPSPSVARDLVHIQKIAVRTVLPRAVTSDGKVGPSGVVLRRPHGAKRDNVAPHDSQRRTSSSSDLKSG